MSKSYVVFVGRKSGIFDTWKECEAQVKGYPAAVYKSYNNFDEAKKALADYRNGKQPIQSSKKVKLVTRNSSGEVKLITPSCSVDAACEGSPGMMEYRGVDTETEKVIFSQGPHPHGTNNIGEFLAIVHALALFKEQNLNIPIYSDSMIAIGWVAKKQCNTKLDQNNMNKVLFGHIAAAENWLQSNNYDNQIIKWPTERWGEIPADYGRK